MSERQPVILSRQKRRDVARWCQLKWICWDAFSAAPLLAPGVAHAFAKASAPLSSVSVNLAPVGVEPPDQSEPLTTYICRSRLRRGGKLHDLVHVSLKLDSLAMFVVGPTEFEPDWVVHPRTRSGRLVRFWPQQTTADIRWDPSQPISIEEFERLARANS